MEQLEKVPKSKMNFGRIKGKMNLKVIECNWLWTILFLFAAAGLITATTFYIQPGSFLSVLRMIYHQPLILVLNYLPALLALCLFYFLLNNVCYAGAVTSLLFNILSMVNRVKIELRDDPFVPRDFQLLQEAGDSMANFDIKLNYSLIFMMIIVVVLFIVLGRVLKFRRFHVGVRIGGAVATIILAFLSNTYIYSSNQVYYHKLRVSQRSYITKVFTELGFTYCFLYNLNTYPVETPENFSKTEVENWIKEYSGSTDIEVPEVKPHVFFIMNEAFSDISNDEKFAYTEENDPLKYYKQLQKSPNVISGHIVIPGFGGGTANTEFDIMTGMQTNLLNSVATSAFRVVGRSTQSIARILQDNDYKAFFMHPGDSWFYNRSSVYRYLGIDDQIFKEAYSKEDKKGNMISDKAVAEKIIEQFNERVAEGNTPIFNYTTTIQNHMAYTVKKYGDLPIEEVPVTKEISQEAKDFFSVYMEGVKDADQMLKDLTDYFETQNEPVVLVFFGDHLPNLGENYFAYKELGLNVGNEGSAEAVLNTYSTPYMIWTNEAAAKGLNLQEKKETLGLPQDGRINANFLPAVLLELLGYEGQDEYFDFLNDIRREIPAFWRKYYETIDGQYTSQLSSTQQELVDKMHKWEYYKMKHEKVYAKK